MVQETKIDQIFKYDKTSLTPNSLCWHRFSKLMLTLWFWIKLPWLTHYRYLVLLRILARSSLPNHIFKSSLLYLINAFSADILSIQPSCIYIETTILCWYNNNNKSLTGQVPHLISPLIILELNKNVSVHYLTQEV